ncbi:MAG: histidine--tRNA ligase [Coriobacteriia bacterium]|nr:histidine--tRNA ligase [Coriobacteriia bacterium]
MEYRAPKGTADLLPREARVWEHMVGTAQRMFARYGYEPVYTPLFEHTDVFVRGIGEGTDIVAKEMYTFTDKGGRSITLRPEGTAPVVRAALEHDLVPRGAGAKLYYIGPMFRYERPQKGRMRQFWQIGVEALGMAEATADAEVIALLWRYFEMLGLPAGRMRLLVNSMGDAICRPVYRDRVAGFIRAHAEELCEECLRRAEANPLRAFDCKNPGCREAMAAAPRLRDELCPECREHMEVVKAHLEALAIPYAEDPTLVRGLDYYTRTVFEIQAEGLGAQNAIGGGGRYDRLMEEYGGPPTPGLGFALGFERTALALQAAGVEVPAPPRAEAYVAAHPDSRREAFLLAMRLREAGVAAEADHQGRSLKAQFKQADRLGARYVVVVAPEELAAGEVTVRDMATRAERRVRMEDLRAAETAEETATEGVPRFFALMRQLMPEGER